MTEEYAILMKRFYSSKLSVLGKDNRTSLKAKDVLSISEILWAIQMQWDSNGFSWMCMDSFGVVKHFQEAFLGLIPWVNGFF